MKRLLSLGIVDRTKRVVTWLVGWSSIAAAEFAAGAGGGLLVALVLALMLASKVGGGRS